MVSSAGATTPPDRAGLAVEAGGDVDRNDAARPTQGLRYKAVDVPRQAGAEYRVDHKLGAGGFVGGETGGWASPMGGGSGCVRPGAGRGQGGDRDRPALVREQTSDDVTVATVIARAGQHQSAAGTHPGGNRSGDGPAGVFHEDGGWDAQRRG